MPPPQYITVLRIMVENTKTPDSSIDLHNDWSGLKLGITEDFDYRANTKPLGSTLPEPDGGSVVLGTDVEGVRKGNVKLFFAEAFPMRATPDGYVAPENFETELALHQKVHNDLLSYYPDKLILVDSIKSLEECLGDPSKSGMALGIEGVEGWDGDLRVLERLWKQGIRTIGPTWNSDNNIATGCKTTESHGLTSLGKEFVKEADKIGFVMDVSHASRQTALDILSVTHKQPVIASHTASRSIVDNVRNLDDDVAVEMGRRGGVIGVTPLAWTVGGKTVEHVVRQYEHYRDLFSQHGIEGGLAIGTDFNGTNVNSAIPGLETVITYGPTLSKALQEVGFTDEQVDQIFNRTPLEFLRKTLPNTS